LADFEIPRDCPSPAALKELGDGDLVRLLVRGYGEAMTVVFDRYYAVMMRVAIRILRNRAEAEDVVQVAFADFYRQIKLFDDGKGNLRAWLLQYVYGRCMNRLKALKVRHHSDHVELSDVSPSDLAAAQESIQDLNESEAKRFVEQMLGTLDERKRRIVELICFAGMTIPEVAVLTDESRTRIQNRYYRAIAEMRVAVRESQSLASAPEPLKDKPARRLPAALKVDRKEAEIG
jgi:RNA polymerase sigma-70 factor, ECF subfamily